MANLQTFTASLFVDNNPAKAFEGLLPERINMKQLKDNEKFQGLSYSKFRLVNEVKSIIIPLGCRKCNRWFWSKIKARYQFTQDVFTIRDRYLTKRKLTA